jgi:hypothetical protein
MKKGSLPIELLTDSMVPESEFRNFIFLQQVSSVENVRWLFHRFVEFLIIVRFENIPFSNDQNRARAPDGFLRFLERYQSVSELLFPKFVKLYFVNELNYSKKLRVRGLS